jgi:glyoxylase-like metal-dependent hydrolase (beta-lactamase superfamily II)
MRIGEIDVTYLPDGSGALTATALFPGTTDLQWAPYAERLNESGGVVTTLGGYFIKSGDRQVIVDTGFGPVAADFPGFGPMRGGEYLASLAAAGVDPAQVTDVIFTHLHLDHCGWTSIVEDDGYRLLFPNAQHWVHRSEWDFWYGGDNPFGPHPVAVQQALVDRIAFVGEDDEPAPGLFVIETPGHTPGHCSLLIKSGSTGERLLLTADTFTSHVQVSEPTWTIAFDLDPAGAVASRLRIVELGLHHQTVAAANHFSQQVFGRFGREGERFTWTPLES